MFLSGRDAGDGTRSGESNLNLEMGGSAKDEVCDDIIVSLAAERTINTPPSSLKHC